ncbi:retrotransposon protein, putative, ty1-copia subclass [Tanacetum coccineum]
MFVIEQPIPPAPTADSAANMLAEWNAIYDAHNEVACLMLGSMTPELHRQFENYSPYEIFGEGVVISCFCVHFSPIAYSLSHGGTMTMSLMHQWHDTICGGVISPRRSLLYGVYRFIIGTLFRSVQSGVLHEMLQELNSMFGKQAGMERFDLIQTFHAYKQEEDLSVGLILNGLTSDFTGFVRNYNMYNMGKTIGKLHAMLIEYEKGLPKKAETPQGKDKQVYIPKPKNLKPTTKDHPSKDDTFHHYKEVGHWKRNCPVYLAELLKKKKQVGTTSSSVSKNDVLYLNVIPSNCIYEIDMHDLVPNVNYIYNVSTKRAKHNLDSTYLWHCRLAHISKKRIEKLQQEGLLKSTDDESFDQCVSCLSGKMTRKSFPYHPERATDLLEIIHTDVCGPLRHVSRQGASYFIIFTDDYSRYGYVYLLKHKHEVFETSEVFKNKVENQLGKTIKALRSDRGGEYISQDFKDYLKACGIIQQLTPLYTPQHNGVSEKRNRTLLDMVRFMMNLATLSLSF